ncbi:MAG: hypothetical protein MZW92_56690 [Comamonadaceae bacterium]|nr:hypothetical protein [Comamonadaceae bacterium]
MYAIADGGGALARAARRPDARRRPRRSASVSMQRGGTSLDTWVLTDGPVDTLLDAAQRAAVGRHRWRGSAAR